MSFSPGGTGRLRAEPPPRSVAKPVRGQRAGLVNTDREHARIVVESELDAVAVMSVDVEIDDVLKAAIEPGEQPEHGVVEVAEARSAGRAGVMSTTARVMDRDVPVGGQAAGEQRAADCGHRAAIDFRVDAVALDPETEAARFLVGDRAVAFGAGQAGEVGGIVEPERVGDARGLRCDRIVGRQPAEAAGEVDRGADARDGERVRRLVRGQPEHVVFDEESGHARRNGLRRRSSPMLEAGPWPQMKRTSSPSGRSLALMPAIRSGPSP